jgi:Mu transposase, C-terminal
VSTTATVSLAGNRYSVEPALVGRGVELRYDPEDMMAQAAGLLAAEESGRHRRVVLVVDEAHLLTPAQLEELRRQRQTAR